MAQSSGRPQELQEQLALVCDKYAKSDEDYRRQILQIEQEQEKNRQEIERLCVLKRQQEMKRDDEYPKRKRDLEAKIIAERDAKIAELLQEYNEIFTHELADMVSGLGSEKAQDEETLRVAYEAFNAGAEKAQAQSQALQATRYCQKAHEDNELLLLQQEIQAEEENQRRREEIEDRRRAIKEKKQEIEKMIQETKEEEEILRRLQQEKTVDDGDTAAFGQDIAPENAPEEQSGAADSFDEQRGASPIPSTTQLHTQDAVQTQHQMASGLVDRNLTENAHTSLQISIGEELGRQFEDEEKLLSTLNEAMSYHGRLASASDQDPSYLHYLQGRLSSSYQCHEIEKRHWRRLFSELCRRHEIDVSYLFKSPFSELDDGAWADLASSASAGSLWVSLFEIFEPYLGSHAGVVIAAYSGESSDIESLEGSAKEAFLYEIKSRSQDILHALYAAIPAFKEFLKVIAPKENLCPFAAPSSPSSGSHNALLELDEHWPEDAASKSGSSHTSISEGPETQVELLTVDLEAEKVMMDARWKIVNGEYTAPWWMKGVPVEKITEEDPYWDKQWTKSRDVGMVNSTSYIDSKECPVHLNQIVSKECIADGGKTNGLLNMNYISSLKAIISILMSWGFTDVEAFQWFRLRLGLQLEEHKRLHPDKSLGLRWKICQFSKTDRKYLTIKQEVEARAHPRMSGKASGSSTPKLSGQHRKSSKGTKRRHSPGLHLSASARKLLEGASKKVRYMPGGPGGGGRWFDENGVETIIPISGSDNRDNGHESVPECTKQNEICNYVILDSDQQMSHNREIVTFDLTHLGSNQNRIILNHLRFQIHLDMSAKILEPGFEVVGANEIDLPSEWQNCLDLKIQLDKVTELKLGSLLTEDRTVWIQHRHPSRHSSAYQEPQIKRSTVKLIFKKVADAIQFIRTISPAIPRRCITDFTYEIVQSGQPGLIIP